MDFGHNRANRFTLCLCVADC